MVAASCSTRLQDPEYRDLAWNQLPRIVDAETTSSARLLPSLALEARIDRENAGR